MTVLGPVTDIPLGEGRTYDVDGEMIAVFRLRDGSVQALSAVCPHQGGPLADGQIDNKVLVCPMHLNAFDIRTGCSLSGLSDLTVYPVSVDARGLLLVSSSEVPS
jgi:nitrite reductase (NADH) small subunit